MSKIIFILSLDVYLFIKLFCNHAIWVSFPAMALDDKIGNFVCGKEFDALLIDTDVPNSPMCLFEEDTMTDIVEKFLYLGK